MAWRVGQNIPQQFCKWYKTQRSCWFTREFCCHSKGPWQAGEFDKPEFSWNKGKCKVLHLERNNPGSQTAWGPTSWKAAFRKRAWGSWLTRASSVISWPRRSTTSWTAWGRLSWGGQGKFSLYSAGGTLLSPSLELSCRLRLPLCLWAEQCWDPFVGQLAQMGHNPAAKFFYCPRWDMLHAEFLSKMVPGPL